LLKELIPGLSLLAVLGDSRFPGYEKVLKETELAAGSYKVDLQYNQNDIETAFETAGKQRSNGLLTMTSRRFSPHRARVAALAVNRPYTIKMDLSALGDSGRPQNQEGF